ncbi:MULTISPECIES: TRAP transporter small permease subunit [unclassified Bordetella]|uniref:TRAP transporter small permease subunit n=1 Tax=unclassified Bordetella TaxID=2630031 RepID=UPI0013255477|nr:MULTISPECIES: TRAP transporter small permease [unclassified Bordetella]MVW70231.1 TRAP transporter small permease subunit [Bordetella sp. 15P40C-2]MVW77984.1 TRAP transporter small permease subunit [Bordetella sp. 02P26C-1]
MSSLSRLLEKLAWATVVVGGLGLMMSMCLGVADVVGTYVGHPVPGAYELTESTMVLVVFGGLAYAQIKRKHIRVELLYQHMSPRVQSTMDIVADLAALVFFALLAWQGWNEALYSWEIDEATNGLVRFPLYPARFVLVFGSVLFLIQMFLDLLEDIGRLLTGVGGRKEDLITDEIKALMEEGEQRRA